MPMTDRRRADLAKIHLAKKALGMDEEAYRALLRRVAGVESAGEATATGRARLLAEFQRLGWRPKRRRGVRPSETRQPQLRKIHALLGERPVAYAEGILKRMYGEAAPARLEWAGPEQLRKVIAALEYDRRRHDRH